jgi:hypothetical protein
MTSDTLRVLLAVLVVLAIGTTVYRYVPGPPLCWPSATGTDCYP